MRVRAADSGCAGMMHYCMGSDSAPDRIDAIRRLLADDLDLAEVLGGREMKRNSRTGSPPPSQLLSEVVEAESPVHSLTLF